MQKVGGGGFAAFFRKLREEAKISLLIVAYYFPLQIIILYTASA